MLKLGLSKRKSRITEGKGKPISLDLETFPRQGMGSFGGQACNS